MSLEPAKNPHRRLWASVFLQTIRDLKQSRAELESFRKRLPALTLSAIRTEVDKTNKASNKSRKIFHAFRLWLECSFWLQAPEYGGKTCELLGYDHRVLLKRLTPSLQPISIPLTLLHIVFRRELRDWYKKEKRTP